MTRAPALMAFGLALALAGCGSTPPTRFYGLTPVTTSGGARTAGTLVLGIGPVELPKTLDRPQIVTRSGQNEFLLGELDQWAEPLADNITAVLSENLAVLVPARRVTTYPWDRSAEIDYQLTAKVLRFDRSVGGDAVLKLRWSLKSPTNENELLARETSYSKKPAGDDYKATVEAMNFLLGQFSRDAATAVRGLREGGM